MPFQPGDEAIQQAWIMKGRDYLAAFAWQQFLRDDKGAVVITGTIPRLGNPTPDSCGMTYRVDVRDPVATELIAQYDPETQFVISFLYPETEEVRGYLAGASYTVCVSPDTVPAIYARNRDRLTPATPPEGR